MLISHRTKKIKYFTGLTLKVFFICFEIKCTLIVVYWGRMKLELYFQMVFYRWAVQLQELELHRQMPFSIAKSCRETTPSCGTKLVNFISKTQNPAMALLSTIRGSVKAVKNQHLVKFVLVSKMHTYLWPQNSDVIMKILKFKLI